MSGAIDVAASNDENVPAGVYHHAYDFADMNFRRDFHRIWNLSPGLTPYIYMTWADAVDIVQLWMTAGVSFRWIEQRSSNLNDAFCVDW